jgi:HSP20 family protein
MGARYFKRAVSLPTEVIGEKAEAEYTDGVLKVTIPKAKPKKVEKKIKIKVKKQ